MWAGMTRLQTGRAHGAGGLLKQTPLFFGMMKNAILRGLSKIIFLGAELRLIVR